MTKDEAVELLRKGKAGRGKFNSRRDMDVDLSDVDLRGLELTGLSFERANLRGADLRGSDLRGSQFRNASLRNTKLQRCRLRDCIFYDTDLRHADLSGADVSLATFARALVADATFRRTTGMFGDEKARFIRGDGNVYLDLYEPCHGVIEPQRTHHRRGWDRLGWDRLRVIALLRLRGVSLVMLPIFIAYVLAVRFYNGQVLGFQKWAQVQGEGAPFGWMSDLSVVHVSPWFAWQIGAWMATVAGALVFWFRCPAVVKEYTQEQFIHEHDRPPIEYHSAKWGRVSSRYICLALAAPGVLYTGFWILLNAWTAVRYVFTR
jgi:uncharacterized protein YjbI with pentapeptide repeats